MFKKLFFAFIVCGAFSVKASTVFEDFESLQTKCLTAFNKGDHLSQDTKIRSAFQKMYGQYTTQLQQRYQIPLEVDGIWGGKERNKNAETLDQLLPDRSKFDLFFEQNVSKESILVHVKKLMTHGEYQKKYEEFHGKGIDTRCYHYVFEKEPWLKTQQIPDGLRLYAPLFLQTHGYDLVRFDNDRVLRFNNDLPQEVNRRHFDTYLQKGDIVVYDALSDVSHCSIIDEIKDTSTFFKPVYSIVEEHDFLWYVSVGATTIRESTLILVRSKYRTSGVYELPIELDQLLGYGGHPLFFRKRPPSL
jgi:hypothetical protein